MNTLDAAQLKDYVSASKKLKKATNDLKKIMVSDIVVSGEHLKELDLTEIIFSRVDFSNCVIDNVDFSDCYFISCKFYNSKLINVNFMNTTLDKTTYQGLTSSECDIDRITLDSLQKI